MKSVFIVFNQAIINRVQDALDHLGIRGFTMWQDVMGRGSEKGEPHLGTHVWPAMNSAIMAVVSENEVKPLLKAIDELNKQAEMQGIRAFVWTIEQTV